MRPPSRLFCLDTVMIDIVMRVAALPTSGADALADDRLITTGGGYNAMSAASRQGMRALYAGRLGTGPFGDTARSALDRDQIVYPLEVNADLDNGFCVVLVEPSGERTFITSTGAESTLRTSDLVSLDVRASDVVLVSGYNVMYPGSAEMTLEWIESLDADVLIAFDPSNRVTDIEPHCLARMAARTDWLVCNEIEASSLSGVPGVDEAARFLARSMSRVGVVVRHGATGCTLCLAGDTPVSVAGFTTTVVDTNGAGDTHSGVFFAELTRGSTPLESARRANAAAAVAIGDFGPATCPSREVLTKWIASRS